MKDKRSLNERINDFKDSIKLINESLKNKNKELSNSIFLQILLVAIITILLKIPFTLCRDIVINLLFAFEIKGATLMSVIYNVFEIFYILFAIYYFISAFGKKIKEISQK